MAFPDRFISGWRSIVKVGGSVPWPGVPDRMEGRKWAEPQLSFASYLFWTVDAVWPDASHSSSHHLPGFKNMTFKLGAQTNLFFFTFARHFITVKRKLTNQCLQQGFCGPVFKYLPTNRSTFTLWCCAIVALVLIILNQNKKKFPCMST